MVGFECVHPSHYICHLWWCSFKTSDVSGPQLGMGVGTMLWELENNNVGLV